MEFCIEFQKRRLSKRLEQTSSDCVGVLVYEVCNLSVDSLLVRFFDHFGYDQVQQENRYKSLFVQSIADRIVFLVWHHGDQSAGSFLVLFSVFINHFAQTNSSTNCARAVPLKKLKRWTKII